MGEEHKYIFDGFGRFVENPKYMQLALMRGSGSIGLNKYPPHT